MSYLRVSRLDILNALHLLSKQKKNPATTEAVKGMKNLLGHLKNIVWYDRIFYINEPQDQALLVTFTDAAVGRERESGRASAGFVMFYHETLLAASSTTQQRVSTSAGEAELVEIYRGSKATLLMRGILETFEEETFVIEAVILTDSKTAIQTLSSPVSTRLGYMAIYIFFVKDLIRKERLQVYHVSREVNVADLMTKPVTVKEFNALWKLTQSPFSWKLKQVIQQSDKTLAVGSNEKRGKES